MVSPPYRITIFRMRTPFMCGTVHFVSNCIEVIPTKSLLRAEKKRRNSGYFNMRFDFATSFFFCARSSFAHSILFLFNFPHDNVRVAASKCTYIESAHTWKRIEKSIKTRRLFIWRSFNLISIISMGCFAVDVFHKLNVLRHFNFHSLNSD